MIDPSTDQLLLSGLQSLSDALWRQRSRLQVLVFKAKVAKLMMATDDMSDVPIAVKELDQASRTLRNEDHNSAKLLRAIARHLGYQDLTISDLSELITEPWSRIMAEHARAISQPLRELQLLTSESRALSQSGLHQVQTVIKSILHSPGNETPEMYDGTGAKVPVVNQAVDQLI